MPNIIIETSRDDLINKPDNLLARINDALWQSGHFAKKSDIKSRIYTPNHCLIGLASGGTDAFIFVHFYLMPGRSGEVIQTLCQTIADAIHQHLTEFESYQANDDLQICVNPIELSTHYVKQLV